MEDNQSPIETLLEKTERYVRTSTELYRLKIISKSADVISTLAARLVVIAFIALFFFIVNIGLALWIGELLGKVYQGFFIVAGFYAFTGITFYIFRNRWIKKPLKNAIITQALK